MALFKLGASHVWLSQAIEKMQQTQMHINVDDYAAVFFCDVLFIVKVRSIRFRFDYLAAHEKEKL